MSLWSALGLAKGKREKELEGRYYGSLDPYERRGEQAQETYLDRAMEFDPTAALERYGQASTNEFSRALQREMENLRGSAVGAGRLDTGFQTQDEDRVVTDLGSRFQDDLARQSLGATGLELRNLEGMGSFGQQQGNTFLDLLTGGLDRETAARKARLGTTMDFAKTAAGLAASSRRWKRAIRPIADALALVEELEGVRFEWKADGRADIGLIAEQVAGVLPEVVQRDAQGDPVAVEYAKLTAVLIEAVKGQQAAIRQLEAKLDALVGAGV